MTKWILFLLSGLSLFAAPPDPQAVKEVMAASDAWKLAMMKKDAAGLQKLMHEDMIYSHSSGMMQTKADVIKATTTGKTVIEAMDFSETTVRVYGNMALIRANVTNDTCATTENASTGASTPRTPVKQVCTDM